MTGLDSLSLAVGQTRKNMTVPSGQYSALYILGAAGNGPAALRLTFQYRQPAQQPVDHLPGALGRGLWPSPRAS